MGNAIPRAVRASLFIFATNILSTRLYNACISMEITIGNDMDTSSLGIGIVPILFSFNCSNFFCPLSI